MKQLFYRLSHLFQLGTSEQLQIKKYLIITRTTTMYFFTHITQSTGQHQLYLRMHIFYSIFNHKLSPFCFCIDIL